MRAVKAVCVCVCVCVCVSVSEMPTHIHKQPSGLLLVQHQERSTWAQLYSFVKASHRNVFLRRAPHSLTALPVIHPEFIVITDRLCFMKTTHYPTAGLRDSAAAE